MTSKVIKGKKIGRTLGFPTANLEINGELASMQRGVYAVRVRVKDKQYKGVLNLGLRPTFEGQALSPEVHILGFSDDIYGEIIEISDFRFLREEKKFNSIEELKIQIANDVLEVEAYGNAAPQE
ncbi:hypothetical protein FACS1894178_8790 [Bacteroidia bacterium]|nr:hypothetical protein FACS1894178_8790 [Bacteroidia bacterium]